MLFALVLKKIKITDVRGRCAVIKSTTAIKR